MFHEELVTPRKPVLLLNAKEQNTANCKALFPAWEKNSFL